MLDFLELLHHMLTWEWQVICDILFILSIKLFDLYMALVIIVSFRVMQLTGLFCVSHARVTIAAGSV